MLEWITKGKTTLIQKDHSKRNYPQQLQTDNVFTYDVENPNCTNKRRNILLAGMPPTIFRRNEKMTQEKKRNRWPIIYGICLKSNGTEYAV